jgi:SAM-dependent methyltransferase
MATREPLEAGGLCPVCGGASQHVCPAPGWGEMRSCVECGLIFAQPLALPMSSVELFSAAYSGEVTDNDMVEFNKRLTVASSKHTIPSSDLTLCSSAHQESLTILKERFAKGTRILEIGCGPGLFMKALRSAGFEAVGCDVAYPAVEFLRSQGFTVFHGSVDDCALDDPEPTAVTCFFVIHHVPDPLGFLSSIRLRFPRSTLIISERLSDLKAALARPRHPRALPPRSLTDWDCDTLRLALEKAGYSRISVARTKFAASEFSVPGGQSAYIRLRNVIPSYILVLYLLVKRIAFWPLALCQRMRRRSNAILAIAEP